MLDIFHTIFKFRDKESPDKLGLYPENVHVNAMPERRYLWTSRVLVILVCLSIAFNMMLASTIYVLLPQRNAAPQLFKVNQNFSQLEQVQPMEINMPVGDLITELHINEYIMQRYQITADYDELMRRWGKGSAIYWYSASDVFADFEDSDVPFNIMQFRNQGLRRDVRIEWTRPLSNGLWMTQFRTYDYFPSSPQPIVSIWRATLRIAYVDFNFQNNEDAIANPFGFLILSYSLAYHSSPYGAEDYLSTVRQAAEESIR